MPGINGLDVLKQLRNEFPTIPVLVLSIYGEDQYAVRVLKAGASGYLSKESAPEELLIAARRIGKTVSEIATELHLSVKTVSTYRSRLLIKMGMKNNAEITHYAIKNGLVK